MKNISTTTRIGFFTLAALLTQALTHAQAGSADHYAPGVFNIRDYFLPTEPGFYGGVYNYYYDAGQFNNASGNQISAVTIRPGVTVNIDPSFKQYAIIPLLMWEAPCNFHGIKYAAYVAPAFANTSLDAEIQRLRTVGVSTGSAGLTVGDMQVQPVWLGYSPTNWDLSLSYSFYAPLGRYDVATFNVPTVGPVKAPAPGNVGLGFWTHQVQGATAWYPWADKRMAVMAAVTWQVNSKKRDLDSTPGQHVTLNYGISEYLPLTKNQKLLLELGPAGYDDWQVTDDSGGFSDSSRQQVHAIGGQVGLTCVPWNAALNFHGYHEYAAESRLVGNAFDLSLIIKF